MSDQPDWLQMLSSDPPNKAHTHDQKLANYFELLATDEQYVLIPGVGNCLLIHVTRRRQIFAATFLTYCYRVHKAHKTTYFEDNLATPVKTHLLKIQAHLPAAKRANVATMWFGDLAANIYHLVALPIPPADLLEYTIIALTVRILNAFTIYDSWPT